MLSLRRALGVALLAPAFATANASAAERDVLVLTETKGFRHESIADGKRLLRTLGAESPSFDVSFVSRSRDVTPKRLSGTEAIVFLNTSGKLPFAKEQASALRRFIREGGGLVGFHAASDTRVAGFAEFPAGVLGARFKKHPFIGPGRVVVEDRSHPATREVPESFSIEEEFYFFRTNPRPRAHVLARLDVSSFGGDPAEDRPLVWCRREGKGRVFYDALGHFPATWRDANQRALARGGVRWALGLGGGPSCRV